MPIKKALTVIPLMRKISLMPEQASYSLAVIYGSKIVSYNSGSKNRNKHLTPEILFHQYVYKCSSKVPFLKLPNLLTFCIKVLSFAQLTIKYGNIGENIVQ